VKAVVTLTCDPSSLTAVVTPEGKPSATSKYTALENNQVKVESSGESSVPSGIYTKE